MMTSPFSKILCLPELNKQRIREFWTRHETRVLRENILSIGVMNVINYIFPLLLIPHLTKTLGAENYGRYAFFLVIVTYFSAIIRFGFDFSVTREVAIFRNDRILLGKIFWKTISARFGLFGGAIGAYGIATMLFPQYLADWGVAFGTLIFLIGAVLLPTWMFQGMEEMKAIAVFNFLIKLISFVLIIVLVQKKQDYILALFLFCFSNCLVSLGGFILALIRYRPIYCRNSPKEIWTTITEGFPIFISGIGISLYREGNVLILGMFSSPECIGFYYTAGKFIGVIQSFCTMPIMQGLYPFMGRKLNSTNRTERNSGYNFFLKFGILYIGLMLIASIGFFILIAPVSLWYLKAGFSAVIVDSRIMSPLLILGSINHYIGMVGLVNLGESQYYAKYVWIAGLVSIVACFILVHSWADAGASFAMFLAEAVLTFLVCRKFFTMHQKIKSNSF